VSGPHSITRLREALARGPDQLRGLRPPEPDLANARGRPLVATGVGSSAGHARYLVATLAEHRLPARFLPLDAFPRPGRADSVLVVFSQGLSPNARLALSEPSGWHRVVLVTASAASSDPERRAQVSALEDAGVHVVPSPGVDEFGTLLRIEGPLTAYAAALSVAEALGAPLHYDGARVGAAAAAALARALPAAEALAPRLARSSVQLLASGAYRDATENLRLKLVEGLLRDVPPVSDPIALAHGPLQAVHAREATWLALTRIDAPHERERLARVRSVLPPERHRLVELDAALPGFEAIFEHEIWMNALVLAALEHAGIDPAHWPGRGADGPVYSLAPGRAPLTEQTWPELEAALAAGRRLAVLPLGAIEQHGPHLPFATDLWIAEALAERLCARLPEAVCLPALALGASSEHLDFPGTLSLTPETLVAVLGDLARSLARHGFSEILCFSAHGGNLGALREADATLQRAAAPAAWIALHDHAALAERLGAVSQADGIRPAEAGHHAGELESSIVAALRPAALRREALAPGRLPVPADDGSLFYPSLRPNAPNGTVGDPRRADPERAARYLDAWVEWLVEAYAGAKNRHHTHGTVKA